MEANGLPNAGCVERADMVAAIVRAKGESVAAASHGDDRRAKGECCIV